MAGKFKEGVGLAQKIHQQRNYQEEQQRLKRKHEIEDEHVVIVERPSLVRFLLKLMIATGKTLGLICILMLATLGLMTLFYPEPRSAILQVLQVILSDGKNMIGI